MQVRRATLAVAVFAVVSTNPVIASCGSAFCLVNTNWGVQGVWNEPGLRSDFRFEYIDQDQPRTGTQDIAVGAIPRHHDEVQTVNRNAFLTLDYGLSQDLGASLVRALGHEDPAGYAARARAALAPLRPEAVDALVSGELLPRLLAGAAAPRAG